MQILRIYFFSFCVCVCSFVAIIPNRQEVSSIFFLLIPAQETPSQMRQKIMQSLQGKVVEILDEPSGLPSNNFTCFVVRHFMRLAGRRASFEG